MSETPTIEAPMFDQMRARKSAPPTPSLLDARTDAPRAETPAMPAPVATPALAHEMPSVGAFFAQGRALVDARRADLARVAMAPEHVSALAMPDLADLPKAPAVVVDALPEANRAKLAMPKGIMTDEAEETDLRGRSDRTEE